MAIQKNLLQVNYKTYMHLKGCDWTCTLLKVIYRFGCAREAFWVLSSNYSKYVWWVIKNITVNGVSKQEFVIIIFYDDL